MYLPSAKNIPQKLNALLTRKHKIFLVILFGLTILLSVVETVGVSIIMPFISIASNPSMIDEGWYNTVYNFFGFTQKNVFIAVFGIAIICFCAVRAIYNVVYTYVLTKFSMGTYRIFALRLFKIYFSMPYRVFVQKNTGEIIHIINNETIRVSNLLLQVLQLFSEFFTVFILYGFMVAVNWRVTLVLTAILVTVVFFITVVLTRESHRFGKKTTEESIKLSKVLHEAFGNFKFVKLRGNEDTFFKRFDDSSRLVSKASTVSATLGVLPRSILENIGFSLLIGAVVFIVWKLNSPQNVIPTISMYALALYRILPGINRMLASINSIAYNQNVLDIVYDVTKQEIENENAEFLPFNNTLKVEGISFKYLTGGDVLREVSFLIKKGESIAITGESGGGKSTLVDILIGINRPTSGTLYVDNIEITNKNIRSWRNKIGYIPQSIYLFDGTVAENVTFSTKYNEVDLIRVLKMANIWEFLEKKDGVHTLVGEGGIQLSGGQKQRVGIARALYTNPEVLVMDEATSSLDSETEGKIMDEIYSISKDKTLIVIAHRLTTVERCNKRMVIEDGRIVG